MNNMDPKQAVTPNIADIKKHLETMAAPYLGEYDDGQIEIAYTAPGDFAPNRAKLFGLDSIDEAATFAAEQNKRGSNIYVGAALRTPDADPNKRADLSGLYAAAHIVVEADENADDVTARITDANGDIAAIPEIKVLTGTTPEKRIHYWIRAQEICDNFDDLSEALTATVGHIGADPKVKDAARIMRLGGTVSYPADSKLVKGYMVETTRVAVDQKFTKLSIEKAARAKIMPGFVGGRDGVAGTAGIAGEIVRNADGKVVDGREAFWMQIVLREIAKYQEELDQDPASGDIYEKCLELFSKQIEGNDRWTSPYGQKRLRHRLDNTIKRLKSGALARSGLYSRETKANMETAKKKQAEYDAPLGDMSNSGMPPGFRLKKHGIEMKVEPKDPDGQVEWHWICSPLRVLSLPRSSDGDDWGRLIAMTDPDGNIKRWAMPAELLANDGSDFRRELMRLGVDISPETKKRQALQSLLSNWRPKARSIVTKRLGWSDNSCTAFALGDGQTVGDQQIVFQSPVSKTAAADMKPHGTLEDWKETVVPLVQGNPLLVFSACMAFGSPLLDLTRTQGGGVNLRGASSKGKTTALEVATSVWGAPSAVQTWRATDNALEGIASSFNSVLLALDEMGQVAPKVAGQAAYMLANGRGKGRANKDGLARTPAEWCLLFLSSGEISLADKMQEAGERQAAGQAVRILDIEATSRAHGLFDDLHGHPGGHEFSGALRAAIDKAHGTAGPKFIEYLLANKEEALKLTAAAGDKLKQRAQEAGLFGGKKPDGQVQRAVQRLSLIVAGGVVANRAGVFPIEPIEVFDSALTVLGLWLNGRGGAGSLEASEAVERTRSFLLTQDSRFQRPSGEFDEPIIPHRRAGWVDDSYYHILPEAWAEIHAGSGASEAAKAVRDAGFIEMQGKNLKFPLPSTLSKSRPGVYRINKKILDGGYDA